MSSLKVSLFSWALAALVACGGAARRLNDEPAGGSLGGSPPGGADEADVSLGATLADVSALAPCEELPTEGCDPTRCVPTGEGCRAPANDCELVTPKAAANGAASFSDGDPCQRVKAECAYDVGSGRCTTFTAVLECPASLDAAQAVVLHCHHSAQPQLQCAYDTADCACQRPPRCSGGIAAPTPEPAAFRCVPHVDASGCPTRGITAGARCSREGLTCPGCAVSFECARGRWRATHHTPRP